MYVCAEGHAISLAGYMEPERKLELRLPGKLVNNSSCRFLRHLQPLAQLATSEHDKLATR